jgi:hypothetical protein
VVSGDGENREIVAEVFSALSEGELHGIIGSLNNSLPVYKRIKRVVHRKEPFPRTASGKIALSRPARPAPRRNVKKVVAVLAFGLVAVVAAVIGLIPRGLIQGNPDAPSWQRELVSCSDTVGEILLVIFALVMTIGAWRALRGNGRKK